MRAILVVLFLLLAAVVLQAHAETDATERLDQRISAIEERQSGLAQELGQDGRQLDRRMDELEANSLAGVGIFVSGIFCALWAQFTRRSAWLWFFFGAFLSPVALIALLWKNALGLRSGELKYWTDR